MHRVHDWTAPEPLEYVPMMQDRHVSELCAAAAFDHVPGIHFVHVAFVVAMD